MATRDEMVSALRGAHEAGDTEAATRIASMIQRADAPPAPYSPDNAARVERPDENYGNEGRSRPENLRQTVERLYSEGAAPKIGKVVKDAGIGLWKGTQDMAEALDKQVVAGPASPIPTGHPVAKAAQAYVSPESRETQKLYDEAGPIAGVTRMLPEAAVTAIPIAGAGARGAKVAQYLLPKALAKFAPAIGDIASNAVYEGGKEAATGGSLGDTASAASWGGAGAAGGRVLTRTLGGVAKPFISDEARTLLREGVTPTPGQLFGDGPIGSAIRSAEDKLTSVPLVGDLINSARKRSISDFNRAEANQVLERLPGSPSVGSAGAEAIDAAQKRISSVYDAALDGMAMTPQNMAAAVGKTQKALQGITLLDAPQTAKLMQFADQRLLPHVNDGKVLTGAEAKALDAEMGHWARQFSRSLNPGDRPLGEAFYALQSNWRDAMAASTTGEKQAMLTAANDAWRSMLPIVKASDKAAAQGGVFTPNQLQRAAGQFKQEPTALTQAAQAVLPSRVPDSGTAGRYLLGGGVAHLTGTVPAAAGAALLYSRPGIHFLVNGLSLHPGAKQYLLRMAPEAAVQRLTQLAEKYPGFGQALSAQAGRLFATQGQQQTEQQP